MLGGHSHKDQFVPTDEGGYELVRAADVLEGVFPLYSDEGTR